MTEAISDFQSEYEHYVTDLKRATKRQYDRNVNKDLSQQKWQELFKRNVTATLAQTYDDVLSYLRKKGLVAMDRESGGANCPTTEQILKPFDGFVDEFMEFTLKKHRTSCAMSNFPDEHNPSREYIADVLQEVIVDWEAFVVQVDGIVSSESISG